MQLTVTAQYLISLRFSRATAKDAEVLAVGVAAAKAAPTGHTGPNLTLEAAKFKKNSVKDR